VEPHCTSVVQQQQWLLLLLLQVGEEDYNFDGKPDMIRFVAAVQSPIPVHSMKLLLQFSYATQVRLLAGKQVQIPASLYFSRVAAMQGSLGNGQEPHHGAVLQCCDGWGLAASCCIVQEQWCTAAVLCLPGASTGKLLQEDTGKPHMPASC
jgi:hypothetical protein